MENILRDDVVFKLRKTRQKLVLALSLTPLGAVRAAVEGLGLKIDVWENPVVYASTRDWSSLYGAIRSEPETAAQSSRSHFWEHSRCLSSACIVLGAVTVTPAENFCFPSLRVLSFSAQSLQKKKKSQCRRTTVSSSKRTFANPSKYLLLCVRQIENETQSTVGEVSQPLKVMALASRLAQAGPDNAVPSLPGSDSWLSKKKQKKIRSLFLHVVQSSYILNVVGTFFLDLAVNKHASITVALVTRL